MFDTTMDITYLLLSVGLILYTSKFIIKFLLPKIDGYTEFYLEFENFSSVV